MFWNLWPFFLLIIIFVIFSVLMLRVMGRGGGSSNYMSLMTDQVDAMKEQITIQKQMLDHVERQSKAMERIATVLEQKK